MVVVGVQCMAWLFGTTGGSDPRNFFGRLKPKNVGSLPPVLVVCSPLLFSFVSRIALSFNGVRAHQGEDCGTGRFEA